MRRLLLTILGAAVVVVLLLAGSVLFLQPRAWVLWVGIVADAKHVEWLSAVRASPWRSDGEYFISLQRGDQELHRRPKAFQCFPSETHPMGGR
jgi:lipopolysaccharide export LptBFGC system permease protein LptF